HLREASKERSFQAKPLMSEGTFASLACECNDYEPKSWFKSRRGLHERLERQCSLVSRQQQTAATSNWQTGSRPGCRSNNTHCSRCVRHCVNFVCAIAPYWL